LRKGQDWPKKKSLIGKGKDGTDIVFFSKLVVLLGLVCYVGLTFSMFVPSIAGCRCDHCYRLPGLFCCKLLLLLLLQAASGSEVFSGCLMLLCLVMLYTCMYMRAWDIGVVRLLTVALADVLLCI